MSRAATKRRPTKGRPVQHPKQRGVRETPNRWPIAAFALAGVIAAALAIALTRGNDTSGPAAASGLPNTPDYHSLLVAPSDPQRLLLGTHAGLYGSHDGGRTWTFEALSGQDAMNLVRPSSRVVWVAGHNVLAKSSDSGGSWTDVRPTGLPSLDVHGFAVDARNERILYAAIAGEGLFKSGDGGNSFTLVSSEVGPSVFGLAVTRDGRILAGDAQQGLVVSRDGGKTWTSALSAQVLGLAINQARPNLVLATGRGVFRSTDAGRTWRQTLELPDGAGPVAWAKSDSDVAYVVGFDRVLYRTGDGGRSWAPVEGGTSDA
jgi:photosystem II stability/assembly factor-like uncharacterized protein